VKGKPGVENVYAINLTTIRDLDQDWAQYSERALPGKAAYRFQRRDLRRVATS